MERKEIGCVRKGKRLLYQSTRVSYQKLASRVEVASDHKITKNEESERKSTNQKSIENRLLRTSYSNLKIML